MVFEESSVKKKIVVLILVGSLFTVASGAFLYFKQSLPIVKKSMIHSKSIHDYAASPPERSYCEEAREAMEEISKYPLTNKQTFKVYALIYSSNFQREFNYWGPDYFYIIKDKRTGKLLVGRINMESKIVMPKNQGTLLKCSRKIVDNESEFYRGSTWFTKTHLGMDQCLMYESQDIKGKYEVYLETDKCLVTKYVGDIQEFKGYAK